MTDIIGLIEKSEDTSKRREIAEYVIKHQQEFRDGIDRIFSAKTVNKTEHLKQLVIDLVDFLPHSISVPVIECAIHDSDSKIRISGLQAAYRTRVESLNSQISHILGNSKEDSVVRKWAVHILSSTDPKGYGQMLRRLARNASEKIELRKEAVYALTKVADDETIGTFCVLLGDAEVGMRRSVAWALSVISSPESVNCLFVALDDDDDEVRDWAIRALRDMDDSRALQGLSDAMSRAPPTEQVRMIRLVVEKRSEIILRAIAELLTSPSVEVRRSAAWAMAVSPYPPAAGTLETLLNDSDEQVCEYAKRALARVGKPQPSDFGEFV